MIIKQAVPGTLVVENEKAALWLGAPDDSEKVYLAYALVTQGPEEKILPSVALDDWGNEVSGLPLYDWIREHGLRFPRAEVFGESPTGAPAQYFLRDLETFGTYPVYAYPQEDAATATGVPLRAVLLLTADSAAPQSIEPPEDVAAPLRYAQVEWWRVDRREGGLDFIT